MILQFICFYCLYINGLLLIKSQKSASYELMILPSKGAFTDARQATDDNATKIIMEVNVKDFA